MPAWVFIFSQDWVRVHWSWPSVQSYCWKVVLVSAYHLWRVFVSEMWEGGGVGVCGIENLHVHAC